MLLYVCSFTSVFASVFELKGLLSTINDITDFKVDERCLSPKLMRSI